MPFFALKTKLFWFGIITLWLTTEAELIGDELDSAPPQPLRTTQKSIFTWMKDKALKRGIEQLDSNSNGDISPTEIIQHYEKENDFMAREGENNLAEIIHQEADHNQDGRTTANELYGLLLGKDSNPQKDVLPQTNPSSEPRQMDKKIESEMDCKQCKQPEFIPSQIDKTWGYFEKRHISCDECKRFCKKDNNCDGIVCYDWPAHAPEHHNLSSCLWMKKEIVGQCIDTGNDNYLTCLKKPQGNDPSEKISPNPKDGVYPICGLGVECPKGFHCVDGFKDSPSGRRCVTMGYIPSPEDKSSARQIQSNTNTISQITDLKKLKERLDQMKKGCNLHNDCPANSICVTVKLPDHRSAGRSLRRKLTYSNSMDSEVNIVGTCIHIGDPCTDSYRDCDAGLICDKDANSGENYCKKPVTVDKPKIENINIDPELDSSRLNIPKECPNGFKRIFSNKGDRDLCHAFFLNPSIHPKTWQEAEEHCRILGKSSPMKIGHLATVNTASENDQLSAAVQELIDSNTHIETFHPWIGFRRGGEDKKLNYNHSTHAFDDMDILEPLNWHQLGWHWTDGTPIPFTDWGVGQPGIDILDNCSCTYLRHPNHGKINRNEQKTGNWFITECAAKSTYVCQVPVSKCEEPNFENYPNMRFDFDPKTCHDTTENNKTMYNIGCKITFSCKDENQKKEYILTEGQNTARCSEDKDANEANWDEVNWPGCDRDKYHCKRPDNLHFGNITFIAEDYDCKPREFEWKGKRDGDDGSRYAAGCNILYTCKEGYLLNGNERGRCHMDGDWGQRPTCKKDEYFCEAPDNSTTDCLMELDDTEELCKPNEEGLYQVGCKIIFTAKNGSFLKGNPDHRCSGGSRDTAKWNEKNWPTCKQKVECFPGFCVDKNNKSIIQSVSLTGIINRKTLIESFTGEHTKEECMEACDKKRSESGFMTACEWKGVKECHFYTKPVDHGNGDLHYQCCVFNQDIHIDPKLHNSKLHGTFRSGTDSDRCDNVCGNLYDCYIERNIEKAMRPEHRTLNKDLVSQDYKELFHNYWDRKIQNFSVTEQELQPLVPNVTITSADVRIRWRKLIVVNAGETFKLKCAVSSWMPSMNIEVEWRKLEGNMPKNTRNMLTRHGRDRSSSKWCKPKCALGESGRGRVLYFNKVTSENSGNYACFGKDQYAQGMSVVQLIVKNKRAIDQARSADKLLPPITKVWAGPDCEAKDDTKCAARQKKNCIELIRRPEETFDVKCLAKGGDIEQVTLEKFDPTTSPGKGLMERVHAVQRNLMTNNQIRPVQFQQPINYDIDSPDSSRQHDDEDLGLNIEKGNWKRFKREIIDERASAHSVVNKTFTNVTKEEEGFWLCRARNMNGESVSCLHLIIAECNLNKKTPIETPEERRTEEMDEEETSDVTVPTPRQCCEDSGIPEFCLGLCSTVDAIARRENRINACKKYESVIEKCFQFAESKNQETQTDKMIEANSSSEPECNSDCECKKGHMCIHHHCKSRSCKMDSDCHKYGMFCHNSTSECRLRCTHAEFTTEYCECGLHQYCKETDEGSICKCPRCGESMDETQSSEEEGNAAYQHTDEESKNGPQLSDEKSKDEMKSAVGITQKTGVTGATKTMKKNMANAKGTGTGGTQNTIKAENAASSKAATVATNIPKAATKITTKPAVKNSKKAVTKRVTAKPTPGGATKRRMPNPEGGDDDDFGQDLLRRKRAPNQNQADEKEIDECESVHNLKDTQCMSQLNTRCNYVGKICKKKCAEGEEHKCKANTLNEMQCNVENGVCESTHRSSCYSNLKGTFRSGSGGQKDRCDKDNKPLPSVCSYNFECPKDFICVNNQCICRKCEEDYDCHRYGMFCHRSNDSSLGECRKRCTPVKVWTEWCGCGVNEICEPLKASITDIDQGFRLPADLGGICKSARCNYHRECDIIWKMDGSKCEDVEVGPFADKDFDQPMESVPTPRECCEDSGVPEFCLGLCSSVDAIARQENRINGCSKYEAVIEKCFQSAESKNQDKAAVLKTGKVCQKTCNWNMPQNNYTVHHFTKDICTDNRTKCDLEAIQKICKVAQHIRRDAIAAPEEEIVKNDTNDTVAEMENEESTSTTSPAPKEIQDTTNASKKGKDATTIKMDTTKAKTKVSNPSAARVMGNQNSVIEASTENSHGERSTKWKKEGKVKWITVQE